MRNIGSRRTICAVTALLGLIVVTGLAATGLAGCGTSTHSAITGSGFLVSDVTREAAPTVAQEVSGTLVGGNNTFGLELFQAVRKNDQNLVCSPYSLSAVLAMTIAGATGATEQEMAEVLHFDLDQAQLHDAFNALDLALSASGEFKVANALWGSDQYSYDQSFVDLLAKDYGAGLGILDFTKAEEARAAINGWVNEKTNGRIPELVGPNDIKSNPPPGEPKPVLMLVDAVYFKADWAFPFREGNPWDGPFNLADGRTVEVPFMSEDEVLPNGDGRDFQALELPYEDGRFSMVLVLPKAGAFEEFASRFDDAKLSEVLGSLQEDKIVVLMPRFEFSSTPAVKDGLKALGMTRMFENSGDFLGMLDTSKPIPDGLYVGGVQQKAFIAVGELGTEASAASAVTMVAGAAAPEVHKQIVLDRPFLYLIRDRESGQIVFLGQVVDPSQTAE